MIEINLLPEGSRRKRAIRLALPKDYLKKTLFILITLIVITHILIQISITVNAVMLASSDKRLAAIRPQRQLVDEMKSEVQGYKAMRDLFSRSGAQRTPVAPALNLISDVLPEGVWLTGLSLSARAGELSGACVSAEGGEITQVGKLLNALKQEPALKIVFPELELSSVKRKKLGQSEIVEFVMSADKQAKNPKKK
jgi:Tfp pilus assembly protein PilN